MIGPPKKHRVIKYFESDIGVLSHTIDRAARHCAMAHAHMFDVATLIKLQPRMSNRAKEEILNELRHAYAHVSQAKREWE